MKLYTISIRTIYLLLVFSGYALSEVNFKKYVVGALGVAAAYHYIYKPWSLERMPCSDRSCFELQGNGSQKHKLAPQVKQVAIKASGNGSFALFAQHEVETLTIDLTGNAHIDVADMPVKEVAITASGNGTMWVHATKSLKLNGSGNATIVYQGKAAHDVASSASGNISVRRYIPVWDDIWRLF